MAGKNKKHDHWFQTIKTQLRQIASVYADAVREGAEEASGPIRETAARANRPEDVLTDEVIGAVMDGVRHAANRLGIPLESLFRTKR